MMTKMEKLVLLLAFWFSPVGVGKNQLWEWFSNDKPATEDNLFHIIAFIINGIDEKLVNWDALEGFKIAQSKPPVPNGADKFG